MRLRARDASYSSWRPRVTPRSPSLTPRRTTFNFNAPQRTPPHRRPAQQTQRHSSSSRQH